MQITPENNFQNYDSVCLFNRQSQGFWSFYYLCQITAVILSLSVFIFAERLSFTTYSMSDGLANDTINKIYPDSRGFLWFCTNDGLSRFDGYKFKNYTQDQGLPHRNINDFLELKDGTYLVGTTAGLALFNPNGKVYRWNILEGKLEQDSSEDPLFKTYIPPDFPDSNTGRQIRSLTQDQDGNIYVASRRALYRFVKTDTDWKFERIIYEDWKEKNYEFNGLFTDSRGNVWITSSTGIYLIPKGGVVEKLHDVGAGSVFEDQDKNIWLDPGGNVIGIRVYSYQDEGSKPLLIASYTKKDGLPQDGFANAIAQSRDGRIFIKSNGTLGEFLPDAKKDEPKFRMFLHQDINTGAIDKSGNIWFGAAGGGVLKYSMTGFQTFDQRDGIPVSWISSIFGNQDGDVFFTTGKKDLIKRSANKFELINPFNMTSRSWGTALLDYQDKNYEWWIPTVSGLLHYPKLKDFQSLAKTHPLRVYKESDGLYSDTIFNIFEDSRGDIWISSSNPKESVQRLEKSTGKIHSYKFADVLPNGGGAIAFGEDSAGNIWAGFFFGGLVRFKNGEFRTFDEKDGIPQGYISRIITDKSGHLWIATTSRGLFRVDNPNDEAPKFVNVSTRNGLSSNQALCLAEDHFGRIFVGTGRGINRINPETGQIKIYTTVDGLPSNVINVCYADKQGVLWFGSNSSIVRFVPQPDVISMPPPIFIDEITVNGIKKPLSDLGETSVANLEFDSDERQIQIGFFGVSLSTGENLQYQYKLNNQDWSTPTDQRTVAFNLSAGTYEFAVRAVNIDGVASEKNASVSFKILPPIWQRRWFIALIIMMIGGAIFALDRYRVRKTRQVEKALDDTKRANIMIRESETRFRTLADTASDAILTIDEDSKIIFVNQAIEKIFGYSAEELIGRKMTMLMPERMRDGHHQGLSRYIATNQRNINWSGVSLPGLHKDGHEIPLELSFGEFEREGKRYFTGIARDVSERKRAEKALQEAREEKFRELERVRRRIATDLHDDIGSSLTQIAVLSEVARGQANQLQAENLSTPLERIKGVSKELVSVMSDIVWAINPNKDFLHDLVLRMRRFASDVYSGKGIKFEFHTPEVEDNISLGANIRREVFAIFKESVNNSAKYSEATTAKVDFQIKDEWLILKVEDNGKGFDTNEILSENFRPEMGGNGLVNMRRRAKDLSGECEIISSANGGTKITLKIPLHLQENVLSVPGQTNGKD